MTNLIKSHSFIVRKANGVDDFRIQLRAAYWTVKSEKALRATLERALSKHPSKEWAAGIRKHYEAGDLLRVLRDFGMIAGSERIIKK